MAMDRGGVQRGGMDRGGIQAVEAPPPSGGIGPQSHHHRMINRAGFVRLDTLLAVLLLAALSEIVGRWL